MDNAKISRIAAPTLGGGAQAQTTLDQICDMFGIGALARSESTILENVRNAIRREECLSAVERAFFMAPAEPDEDFPDEDPGEECLLGWGRDPQQYVDQFREAFTKIVAPGAQAAADDARDQAAKLAISLTAIPRDLLGPASTSMKTTAAIGEKIAAAIRAIKPPTSPTTTAAARQAPAEASKPLAPELVEKNAVLKLSLRAESGYMADEMHRISADQWGRILRIANEKPAEIERIDRAAASSADEKGSEA